MNALADFLLARIAEDEAAARDAGGARWHWEHGSGDMCNDPTCPFGSLIADTRPHASHLLDVHGFDAADDWQGGPHIVRHDPARVLAECAAKRAIVELATAPRTMHRRVPWHSMSGARYSFRLHDEDGRIIAEGDEADRLFNEHSDPITDTPVLRILAQPYSDHPDYQQAWSPDTEQVKR